MCGLDSKKPYRFSAYLAFRPRIGRHPMPWGMALLCAKYQPQLLHVLIGLQADQPILSHTSDFSAFSQKWKKILELLHTMHSHTRILSPTAIHIPFHLLPSQPTSTSEYTHSPSLPVLPILINLGQQNRGPCTGAQIPRVNSTPTSMSRAILTTFENWTDFSAAAWRSSMEKIFRPESLIWIHRQYFAQLV